MPEPENPENLAAWGAYTAAPNSASLAALVASARAGGLLDRLPMHIGRLFAQTANWRVAQHAALLFLERRELTLAFYYAERALGLRGGAVLARLVYCDVAWARHLCLVVLYQFPMLRKQVSRIQPTTVRRHCEAKLANIMLGVFSYTGDLRHARHWYRRAQQLAVLERRAAISALIGASQARDHEFLFEISSCLVPVSDTFGGRVKSLITFGYRYRLCEILKARQ